MLNEFHQIFRHGGFRTVCRRHDGGNRVTLLKHFKGGLLVSERAYRLLVGRDNPLGGHTSFAVRWRADGFGVEGLALFFAKVSNRFNEDLAVVSGLFVADSWCQSKSVDC